jgi:hypothetical protein
MTASTASRARVSRISSATVGSFQLGQPCPQPFRFGLGLLPQLMRGVTARPNEDQRVSLPRSSERRRR